MSINFSNKQLFYAVQFGLILAIFVLVAWPAVWDKNGEGIRKITVTGEATIEASPDEYTFNPYFEAKGNDQEVLKSKLTKQTEETISELKNIGLSEEDIKLDISSYDQWYWKEGDEGVLTASLQIEMNDKALAEKVQKYLLETEAKGQLTPQAVFSEAKRKELDSQVTDEAIDDAKSKAEKQASRLDAKIGRVIEVNQAQDSVFPIAYAQDAVMISGSEGSERSSLPILSGKNEYTQTVNVTFELQ